MEKYYLYMLISIFLFLNGVPFFEDKVKKELKEHSLLLYKLKKQKGYLENSSKVKELLAEQSKEFDRNNKFFFKKNQKETLVFSEMQSYIQYISKSVGAKINQFSVATVIKTEKYSIYPISFSLFIIPEDLDIFLDKLYKSKKYFFIDVLFIAANKREKMLLVKMTLKGYQLQ